MAKYRQCPICGHTKVNRELPRIAVRQIPTEGYIVVTAGYECRNCGHNWTEDARINRGNLLEDN